MPHEFNLKLFVSFTRIEKAIKRLNPEYTSLTLNGKHQTSEALLSDAGHVLQSWSTPGWQKKIYLFIQEWLSPAAKIEVTTSGSTGAPRIISFSREKMIKSALRTGEFLGLKPGDRALLCLPVDYIAGKMMIVRAFVLGLDLVTVYPSSNPLPEGVEAYDFAAMTPMQVHHVLHAESGRQKLGKIGNLIIGGGDMDALIAGELSNLPPMVYHTYGMTETLTHVAMKKITPLSEGEFRALPGVRFEKDQRNCLVINDTLLGIQGLETNDQVELLSATSFNMLGRIDNIINSGGIKINPEVIENRLQGKLKHRIVVAGKMDSILGEKVILIVETRKDGPPADLIAVLRGAGLDKFEKPREIFFVDAFPETSSGKIRRKKLMERIALLKGQEIYDLD
jgi:O-succinylbenzoic acid--CoA ligase